MKQILQNLRNGKTEVADVPCPAIKRGHVLVGTTNTLVSAGTERMLVSFGQSSLLGKARAQPDKVRQVLDKIRTDGLAPTLEAVFNKLDQPLPLGYCNVGQVLELGDGVTEFSIGDRVVSNGHHAEVVSVPKNLCCRIPDRVTDEAAVFTVIGAIGLQGIRLIQPTLGESFVVTGLGLIGLMTVQLLRAQGCRVLGIDFDPRKLALAEQFGASVVRLADGEDPVAAANTFSRGRGVDGVLITASTSSNEPVHQAAIMCRKRGRIVLVGVAGLELSRADFYEKELSFQVSCSYGPGRYDPAYEQQGVDYPPGLVRWTEQRNFEAVLDMLAEDKVDTRSLISHRFEIDQAEAAYSLVTGEAPSLGIVLRYPGTDEHSGSGRRIATVPLAPATTPPGGASLGFIGSGNYATAVLIPAFKASGAQLLSVASSTGVTGLHAARKFGFQSTTTDTQQLLDDPRVEAVVISTRHDSHAALTVAALDAGKHVFVEKPLALSVEELERVRAAWETKGDRILMVGFNRRFAPQIQRISGLLEGISQPKVMVMTVNAGAIPRNHWTQDPAVGGGRIVGEACHFIDLLRFLARSPIRDVEASGLQDGPGGQTIGDVATITLRFEDGSIGTIHYLANGHKSFAKERLEIFTAGRILQLDNFRRLSAFGWPGFKRFNLWRQDKGQRHCAAAFVAAVRQGSTEPPIAFADIMEVSRATLAVAAALR
ncbi:MAG: bi-domain-containing oxidoreductase [Gemmatimonadales bacterium]|nr:bi-domain-containing oxidoreductase [Gemmatimonadales bacterium]MDZ4390378.1 bi-domain-containing oxidoreductase [Gemmatimonadales bacterium]